VAKIMFQWSAIFADFYFSVVRVSIFVCFNNLLVGYDHLLFNATVVLLLS
jgi:hypothetical protein